MNDETTEKTFKVAVMFDNGRVMDYRVKKRKWDARITIDRQVMFTTVHDMDVILDLDKVCVIELKQL